MTLNDVLNQVIDDGIEAARSDYSKPRDRLKLDGAVKGFEECRGKTPDQIGGLLFEASLRAFRAIQDGGSIEQYWYWRCRALEIEWVANVMSNVLVANGFRPITTCMTVRGAQKAAEIVGIRGG